MNKSAIKTGFAWLALTTVSSLAPIGLMSTAIAGELTVNVKDISSDKGYLMVALYAGEKNYNESKSAKAVRVKVNGKQETIIFTEVADGDYAIKMYHDENDNMTLDKNILGIPSEGYGFSNNKGQFGLPSYQDASFLVKDNTNIEINLF